LGFLALLVSDELAFLLMVLFTGELFLDDVVILICSGCCGSVVDMFGTLIAYSVFIASLEGHGDEMGVMLFFGDNPPFFWGGCEAFLKNLLSVCCDIQVMHTVILGVTYQQHMI
jgi:hypothetical protein